MRKLDLTNQRFGKLVVSNQSNVKYSDGVRWVCNCDCGKTAVVRANHLRNGRTNSCGCLYKRYSPSFESAYIGAFDVYLKRAQKFNRAFQLTIGQFRDITSKPCYYCGSQDNVMRVTVGMQKGLLLRANGIDRYDNDIGYTLENSVPCCKICNFMKTNLPAQQFLEHVTKIADFQRLTMEQPHEIPNPIQ